MNEVTTLDPQSSAPVAAPADPMMEMLERVIMTPDLPMERVMAMMDVQERQMNKVAEQAFNEAFSKAMAQMPNVPRSGKGHTGPYSTLDDLIRTTRPALSANGLSLNWETSIDGNTIWVKAVVRHALGHSISTALTGERDTNKTMNDLQGGGSTQTYLKRYTGFAILGLSSGDEIDDDGRSAGIKLISAAQFQELTELMEQAGVDEKTVCTAANIQILPELPAGVFEKIANKLRKTIASEADAGMQA